MQHQASLSLIQVETLLIAGYRHKHGGVGRHVHCRGSGCWRSRRPEELELEGSQTEIQINSAYARIEANQAHMPE